MRRIRKAQPTPSDVHVSRPLTNISVAYVQQETKYIAARVFPPVPVMKQGDLYYVYTRADWLRDEAQKRAPATESAGGGFNVTTASYFAEKYSFHKDVDDDVRANSDAGINPDSDATRFVTQILLTRREVAWATRFFVTGVWASEGTPATLWNVGTSTPIEDVSAQLDVMENGTGYRPNIMVVAPQVHTALKNHPDIIDRIKYTQRGVVTMDLLAQLFEVDEYMVARAVVNSAIEGATESTDYIVGKNALLAYRAPSPGLMVPSAGYIFNWTGLLGAGAAANRIKRFRMEELSADRIEGDMAWDQKVVASDLGYLFLACVA
jgi:hypothetical protein